MLDKKNIKLLIVHCSDTPDTDNIGALEIHEMHTGFGWEGIGYHKVIKRDGTMENGRPEFWKGAHVKGKNDQSLGICLIGRNYFTPKQLDTLYKQLKKWKICYPNAEVVGHRDAIKTKKTCPNFDVVNWWKEKNIKKF